jgi:hypothetical protein
MVVVVVVCKLSNHALDEHRGRPIKIQAGSRQTDRQTDKQTHKFSDRKRG